jgi:hypothetical protein
MILTLEEAEIRYGKIENFLWQEEARHCQYVQIPKDISENWINSATGKSVNKIYCNRDMSGALLEGLQNVRDRKLIHELETFDGCLNIRDVRGAPGKVSTHAYALSLDINAATNRLGTKGNISSGLVSCFKDAGFIWGGEFERLDPMHFQYAKW